MTETQRGIYMMLCMAGRTEEAMQYKIKCETKEGTKTAPTPEAPEEERSK